MPPIIPGGGALKGKHAALKKAAATHKAHTLKHARYTAYKTYKSAKRVK